MEDNVTANSSQHVIVATQKYSGPLPPADELKKYNEVSPQAAERIIAMAERQAAHRQKMEFQENKDRRDIAIISIIASTLSVGMLSGVIIYVISMQSEGAAIAASIGAIASVAGLFLYHKKKKE